MLPLGGDRVLVANDNNFPGNDGRIPGRADDTELIAVDVPGLRQVWGRRPRRPYNLVW